MKKLAIALTLLVVLSVLIAISVYRTQIRATRKDTQVKLAHALLLAYQSYTNRNGEAPIDPKNFGQGFAASPPPLAGIQVFPPTILVLKERIPVGSPIVFCVVGHLDRFVGVRGDGARVFFTAEQLGSWSEKSGVEPLQGKGAGPQGKGVGGAGIRGIRACNKRTGGGIIGGGQGHPHELPEMSETDGGWRLRGVLQSNRSPACRGSLCGRARCGAFCDFVPVPPITEPGVCICAVTHEATEMPDYAPLLRDLGGVGGRSSGGWHAIEGMVARPVCISHWHMNRTEKPSKPAAGGRITDVSNIPSP